MNQSWHMVIWRNIMQRIHEGLEYKDFTIPSSVVQRTICTQTGKLAVSGCPSLTEYFDKETVVKETCPGHRSEEPEEPEDDENTTDRNNGDDADTPDTPNTPSIDEGGSGEGGSGGEGSGEGGNSGGDSSEGGGSGETTTPSSP